MKIQQKFKALKKCIHIKKFAIPKKVMKFPKNLTILRNCQRNWESRKYQKIAKRFGNSEKMPEKLKVSKKVLKKFFLILKNSLKIVRKIPKRIKNSETVPKNWILKNARKIAKRFRDSGKIPAKTKSSEKVPKNY